MKLTKRRARLADEIIHSWVESEALSPADAERLRASIEVVAFDWLRLAKYSFWVAIACIAIAVGAALADNTLLLFLARIVRLTAWPRVVLLVIVAVFFYNLSLRRRRKSPERVYGNEALCFLGVLATAGAVESLGRALSSDSDHFSVLFLLAAVVYGVIGLSFPSTQVWVFALFSFASWVGFESGYLSGWGAYYLGMSYPLRFLSLGMVLIAASHVFPRWPQQAQFWKPTFIVGMLFVFISLWIMSIFGNYGDLTHPYRSGQAELLFWCLLFAAASMAAIWYGLKFDERSATGFGITFLFINLYTRYFEYFWTPMHKAVFFALLGASFWYLGSRAEQIWTLGGRVAGSSGSEQR